MSQLEEVEISIEQAKSMVDMLKSLRRLESNRDFKKIFTNGYFKEESLRMVGLLGSSAMHGHREQIVEALAGVSLCQDYLRNIANMGANAEQELLEMEEVRDELLENDGEFAA